MKTTTYAQPLRTPTSSQALLTRDILKSFVAIIEAAKAAEADWGQLAHVYRSMLEFLHDVERGSDSLSASTFFSMCARFHEFLSAADRTALETLLARLEQVLERSLEEHRDPAKPLLPHRILPFSTHRYAGSPWYLASFHYSDPVWAGTTNDLHLAYIRVREPLARDGEDLPLDHFVRTKHFHGQNVFVRLHSECLLGDSVLGQSRCDCGSQFVDAADLIEENGIGVVLYLRQEGRGIGLQRKLESLEHSTGRSAGQWTGVRLDTEQSMLAEGHHKADYRGYQFAARILRGLGIDSFKLISSNPNKVAAFRRFGMAVEQVPTAGIATTIENLSEFLWKLLNGYHIPFRAIHMVEHELSLLRQGHSIDATLLELLRKLLVQAIQEDGGEHLPPQLTHLLRNAAGDLGGNSP